MTNDLLCNDGPWPPGKYAATGSAHYCKLLLGHTEDHADGDVVWENVNKFVVDPAHIRRQREWSLKTFGPGRRTKGIIDHIRKELIEIENDPIDISEWVDVITLAFDGAWRAGAEPEMIIKTIKDKYIINIQRSWPDWRTLSESEAIEHDRTLDPVTKVETEQS